MLNLQSIIKTCTHLLAQSDNDAAYQQIDGQIDTPYTEIQQVKQHSAMN